MSLSLTFTLLDLPLEIQVLLIQYCDLETRYNLNKTCRGTRQMVEKYMKNKILFQSNLDLPFSLLRPFVDISEDGNCLKICFADGVILKRSFVEEIVRSVPQLTHLTLVDCSFNADSRGDDVFVPLARRSPCLLELELQNPSFRWRNSPSSRAYITDLSLKLNGLISDTVYDEFSVGHSFIISDRELKVSFDPRKIAIDPTKELGLFFHDFYTADLDWRYILKVDFVDFDSSKSILQYTDASEGTMDFQKFHSIFQRWCSLGLFRDRLVTLIKMKLTGSEKNNILFDCCIT